MWGVNQQNIRAYYKMLYGKISNNLNDLILITGYISCIAMPLLGVLDMHNYYTIHLYLAIAWFVSLCLYMGVTGRQLYIHRKEFPPETQRAIKYTKLASYGLFIGLIALTFVYV